MIVGDETFIACITVVSIVHSIALTRVCLFVIDRVYPDYGKKDQ
jgi:hypothetical protein